MKPLAALATVLEKATALRVKGPKCVAVPMRASQVPTVEGALRAQPVFVRSRVSLSAVYLGVAIGSESRPEIWRAASLKFWERTSEIVHSSWSQTDRVCHFQVRAVSVLRYLLSLRAPPPEVCKLYQRACQRIWKTPFNAVPSVAMDHARQLGFASVADIRLVSQASRIAVILRSEVFAVAESD